jgi:hypothetical protein
MHNPTNLNPANSKKQLKAQLANALLEKLPSKEVTVGLEGFPSVVFFPSFF